MLDFCNYGLETGRERSDVYVLGGYCHFAGSVKAVFGTMNDLGFLKVGFRIGGFHGLYFSHSLLSNSLFNCFSI